MSNIVSTIGSGIREGKWRTAAQRSGAMLGLAAVVILFGACAAPRVIDTSRSFKTVVIDAGHGGTDRGTWSRWAGAEKDATLGVARRLEPKLRAAGFKTVMTRTQDVNVELNERPRISNRQINAVFVSIHFNEARARRVHGTETYYKSPLALGLATNIHRAVSALPGHCSRGIRTANFRVLRLNQFPAVLVECGYFSSPSEGSLCCRADEQERIAGAIARGIVAQHGGSAQ